MDDRVESASTSPTRDSVIFGARLERFFVWGGLLIMPVLLVGQLLSRTLPAWSPELSPQGIVDRLLANEMMVNIGLTIHTAGVVLYGTWGAAITAWIWRMESHRRPPILTLAHGILVGGNVVYFELIPLLWSTALYRAGEVSPQITQQVTDFGWFLYLGSWPGFSLQAVLLGLAVMEDRKNQKLFELGRSVIFWSFAFAFVGLFSAPMGFFKSGPFAWDGLLALWVVLATYGVWEVLVSWQMLKAISRDERRKLAAISATVSA